MTQENLSRALSSVGRVVSARASLPVLSNVLLATDGNRLRLSATNLEIGINYWVGSKVEQQGSVTVPARLFAEFVSSLPHGTIELSGNDTLLAVKTPNFESKLNGILAEEFPEIPTVTTDPVLTLSAAALKEALAQVVVAASADEARPVLAGVYLYTEDNYLYLVATDSYRLAEKRIELEGEVPEHMSVIVPARTMQELARLLGDASGDAELYLDENQVMFRLGDIELVSRLIEGQFPQYRGIIPDKAESSFEIDVAEFTRITKVASLFARESAGSVRLDVRAEGQVSVMSSDSEVGGNTSSADCEVAGDDAQVSLNARYLTDALGVIKTPRVTFATSGKDRACVLSPAGEGAADDYIHIIMPLRT
ncbi:MAG TPA: DNA polymerase III subunit beta [Candidatus Saccharimonadia bacterium]